MTLRQKMFLILHRFRKGGQDTYQIAVEMSIPECEVLDLLHLARNQL